MNIHRNRLLAQVSQIFIASFPSPFRNVTTPVLFENDPLSKLEALRGSIDVVVRMQLADLLR